MKKPASHKPEIPGFALVVTLSLMILLTIVAVGLLSLSAISLRGSSQGSAQSEARANARLALMLAIGELQKEMGPDQRVSASGAIVATDESSIKHPHWTGVWDSWKAGPTKSGDDATSEHSTIEGAPNKGMAPTYQDQRKDHFRSWLVSLSPNEVQADKVQQVGYASSLTLTGVPMPDNGTSAVQLLGRGSLGTGSNAKDYVSARLLSVKSSTSGSATSGRYGWWVGDESQKARIMDDSYESSSNALTPADKIFRQQAPGSTGTTTAKGLENITKKGDGQLGALPSLQSLDLVDGATGNPAENFLSITPFSFQVLADVREGGLKRDLSTILEQPILRSNSGPEYMLYEFDDARFPDRSSSRVPIQDLAAYYQLYDNEPTLANQRRGGVQYTYTGLPDGIRMRVPDFDGGTKDRQKLLREYTALYRQPVITKVQFLVAMTCQPITAGDRQEIEDLMATTTVGQIKANLKSVRLTDTHKLRLGIMPMITLWNPNNVPLVMDAQQILRFGTPPFGMRWRKYRAEGDTVDLNWFNLNYAASATGGGATTGQGSGFTQLRLRFAKDAAQRIVFEPGEVKVFSLPSNTGATLNKDGKNVNLVTEGTNQDTFNGWDPFGFFLVQNSSPQGAYCNAAPEAYMFKNNSQPGECMVFAPGDRISLSIDTDSPEQTAAGNWRDGRVVSRTSEITGAGFNLYMLDEGYQAKWQDAIDSLRNYVMISRHGNGSNVIGGQVSAFNKELLLPGFPGAKAPIDFDASSDAFPGSQIIASAGAGEVISLMEFSLSVGCEVSSKSAGGFGGGRRVTSRPFLHSSSSAGPFIDQSTKESLYNYGWDWQIGKVNTVEDSIVTAKPGSGNGYYGGGYTVESGTTHVVQREIPVLPPICIASLSHAELGGFSLAYANPMGDNPDTDTYWFKSPRMKDPINVDYQRTTASGQNGLAPHIVQAIGNSYAHPNIPADKASTTWTRLFDQEDGSKVVPFVDHSYLANKALWDEFFFSSIAPQPSKVPLFGTSNRTAKVVAEEFFRINDPKPPVPLPNRRIQAYTSGLDQAKLNTLFTQANTFTNGLADKIAANLMVEGAFNVNSTSVEAWKVFLSSLKGKPVAYLDGGTSPKEASTTGTPVSPGSLPNGAPITSASITKPNSPPEQWKSGRVPTDKEIGELADAIVKQVKLRGPFLSLSEFVNRRLDGSHKELALKGAMQAALDDDSVSINEEFRTPARMLDSETTGIGFAFPEAANGPIAYGSAPYVDQADILRNFGAQLTPRGDTFVIRTYGDSLDPQGKVQARAWCEAVVQRIPEYIDGANEPQMKTADPNLTTANKVFGRKFQIVGFRWLNSSEV